MSAIKRLFQYLLGIIRKTVDLRGNMMLAEQPAPASSILGLEAYNLAKHPSVNSFREAPADQD